MPTDTGRAPGPIGVAVLAGALHVVVGYFYAVSGLVMPLYALLPLWMWWVVLAWVLVRLALQRSWWPPVVPVIAAATWWLLLVFGESALGWQA